MRVEYIADDAGFSIITEGNVVQLIIEHYDNIKELVARCK